MTPDERRAKIAAILRDCPEASQRMIADAVGCSQATVARDCAKLSGDSVIHIGDSPGAESADAPPQVRQVPQLPEVPEVSRGAALVERLRAEMSEQGLIPTSGEEELLSVACDLADRIEALQGMVAVDGERRVGKDGGVRLHPALSEIRQCEATLARVVGGINTMAEAPVNRTKQRAAQSRWRAHNAKRAAIAGGGGDGT
jgi:DNA-binding Lrp family transcriptional regulator